MGNALPGGGSQRADELCRPVKGYLLGVESLAVLMLTLTRSAAGHHGSLPHPEVSLRPLVASSRPLRPRHPHLHHIFTSHARTAGHTRETGFLGRCARQPVPHGRRMHTWRRHGLQCHATDGHSRDRHGFRCRVTDIPVTSTEIKERSVASPPSPNLPPPWEPLSCGPESRNCDVAVTEALPLRLEKLSNSRILTSFVI